MPLLTQSDPGTENYGIANAQTVLRHRLDPSLSASLQHQFRGNKGNVKPEIAWKRLRFCWTPGFERVLQFGVDQGLYDPDDSLERLVFQYVFIPWLQRELDIYREEANDSKPRFNRHKLLPHGRPLEIFQNPREFNSEDYSVNISPELLAEARARYATPTNPVFELVPPAFSQRAAEFYGARGPPTVTEINAWHIYLELLQFFRSIEHADDIRTVVAANAAMPAVGDDPAGEEYMELLPLNRYRWGNNVGQFDSGVDESATTELSSEEEMDYGDFTDDDYIAAESGTDSD